MFLEYVFRVVVSYVVYLYVSGTCSGSITSVGEERANLSAVIYLLLCGFCLERFSLPLGAWDGLRYFIVALPEPSIHLLTKISSEFEFLISNGMLFQMIAPEYDKLFLNKFSFGLGIKKFLFSTDRRLEIVSSEAFLL